MDKKNCEHYQWHKWEVLRCDAEIVIQGRQCRECGWSEIKAENKGFSYDGETDKEAEDEQVYIRKELK